MFVFHNPHAQEIVHLRTGVIQFTPSERDENDHLLGVFRTESEAVRDCLLEAIAHGHTPARLVDEEEAGAMDVLKARRARTAQKQLAQRDARTRA